MDEIREPIAIDHPRFHVVSAQIFTRRLAPDCMEHRCAVVQDEQGTVLPHPHERFDVCCQYGCDVDLTERDAILGRADAIRSIMRAEAAAAPWFEDETIVDADYPSGKVVRSQVLNGGCIFLSHDKRGCAIHRAALEQGWDFRTVKPGICRLFPVTYEGDSIFIAGEYPEYSCAYVEGTTVYRLARDSLADLFGPALVAVLDAVEERVLAATPPPPRRLPIVSSP
jgi:Fe-S-cluster containining protein